MATALIRFTEHLDLDVDAELWRCRGCATSLGPASENYKRGCLVADRDPRDIHPAGIAGEFSFAPDPVWVRILEFYCPGCGRQVETEYLPPGHPITVDIEVDVPRLKARLAAGTIVVRNGKLTAPDTEAAHV
jgi:acetophenone carboxylase